MLVFTLKTILSTVTPAVSKAEFIENEIPYCASVVAPMSQAG